MYGLVDLFKIWEDLEFLVECLEIKTISLRQLNFLNTKHGLHR